MTEREHVLKRVRETRSLLKLMDEKFESIEQAVMADDKERANALASDAHDIIKRVLKSL